MLSKENRLKKEKDFEAVFKSGKGFKEELLRVKISRNNLNSSRFGFIVSKKYSKKASERNLLKRRMREIVRKNLPNLKKGFDVVFFAMPGLENDFEVLSDMCAKIFKKTGLLK